MGTPGAIMLFALPPLAVYAIAYWARLASERVPIAPVPRVTALDNAFERFERSPANRAADGKFAKRT